jgi:hypothetical protein
MRVVAIKMTNDPPKSKTRTPETLPQYYMRNFVAERDHSGHGPSLFLPDFLDTGSIQVFNFLDENSTSITSHTPSQSLIGPIALHALSVLLYDLRAATLLKIDKTVVISGNGHEVLHHGGVARNWIVMFFLDLENVNFSLSLHLLVPSFFAIFFLVTLIQCVTAGTYDSHIASNNHA